MKTWISAALVTAAVAFGGAFASTGASAAPQPSQKAAPGKADMATDISAQRRHRHHSHRHHMHRHRHMHGYYRGYAPRYVRPYQRSYYLQPAYSGRPYGYGGYAGYRPSYYGSSFYGDSFGGYGRPYGYGGYGGFGHRGYGYGGGFGPSIGIGVGFGGPGFGFGRW